MPINSPVVDYTNDLNRAESSQSHSDPRKRSRAPSNINSTPADPTSGRQRRITSMSKQLETCHIEKDKKAATTGIYASPYTILSPMDPALNLQSASFTPPAESNQAAVPSFPFPHPSMSWWNDPLPSIQPDSTFNHDWRPVLYGETPNKNRKSDGELEEAMLHPTQGPRRVQLSPQTSHGAAVSDIGNSFGGMHSRTLDMFGGSNLQPEFGPANPSQSAMASWPNFTWNPFDNVSAGQGMPRYLPQAIMPINMTVADRMWPNNQFSPQQFIQTSASSSRIQNNSRDPQSDQSSISPKTNPSALPLAQYIQPSTPATQRRSHQQHMSAQSQSARTAPLATSTGSNNQGQVSNALFHSPANQQKVPKDTTFPPPVHSQFHTLPSDIQRKPSLYKIPRWPSRPESHSPSHPLKTVAQPPSSSTNVNSDMGPNIPTESRTNKSDHPLPASNEVQSQQDGLQALSDLTSVQSAIRAATPQAATFQDQDQLAGDPSPENSSARKAGRKKHSPNLYVSFLV